MPGESTSDQGSAACKLCGTTLGGPLTYAGEFCCSGCARVHEVIMSMDEQRREAYVEAARSLGLLEGSEDSTTPTPPESIPTDPEAIREDRFAVTGLVCPACSSVMEKVVATQKGVSNTSVDFFSSTARISYDMRRTSPDKLNEMLSPLGYAMEEIRDGSASVVSRRVTFEFIACAIIFMNMMSLSFLRYFEQAGVLDSIPGYLIWVEFILCIPVLWLGWTPMIGRAWRGIRVGQPNMDLLIAIAVAAAFGLSVVALVKDRPDIYFETAAGLVTISLLSRMIEARLRQKAFAEVATLMRMQAIRVRVVDDEGKLDYVLVSEVQPGQKVVLEAGETVPFDGTVAGPSVHVSEAVLTGEPLPVIKNPGEDVVAGSAVAAGTLTLTVKTRHEHTRLAQITRSVSATIEKSEGTLRSADRIARWFVPAVVCVAALSWVTRALVMGWDHSLTADGWFPSVAILAVACPCAFSLAGVAALTSATGALLRRAVLVKQTDQLEAMANIDHVIFDKTGTLTEGLMKVTSVLWRTDEDDELLSMILAAESGSDHPVAQAIREHLLQNGVTVPPPVDGEVEERPGEGMLARMGETTLSMGAPALFDALFEIGDDNRELTRVWFGRDGRAEGCFLIEDRIHPQSRDAVHRLKQMGIDVEMVSGDRQPVCDWVGETLGIERRAGGVTLDEKVEITKAREGSARNTAFVGDGTNDALAMKEATVSVALARATDEALTASGFVLLAGNVGALPALMGAGRKLTRVIRGNYFWAFAFNTVFIPVAALGQLTPLIAMLLMLVSSAAVLLNSLRLRTI